MVQKLLIEIDTTKPLSSYGEGHVLLYDSSKNRYYVLTREELLKVQNDKISKLEREMNEFIEKMENKNKEFLKTYQETNAKVLEMVKSVVLEKGDK